jgi:hypothetical protein
MNRISKGSSTIPLGVRAAEITRHGKRCANPDGKVVRGR